MPIRANERVAYFNGEYLPEGRVLIPFRDRGFKYGDAAFDMTRTFGGEPFRMLEHVERLYRTLKYMRIDPGLAPAEMIRISEEVNARNRHLIDERADYWIAQRVSRGVDAVGDEGWAHTGPNVIVECVPMPIQKRAPLYRDGIEMVVPSIRRTPPESLTPRAKMHNYLNLIMAELEGKAQNPEAWVVVLDIHGNIAEGMGSNVFVVQGGEVLTPEVRFVLPGISRLTVMELCQELAIPCRETSLDLFDAYTADEVFLSSTSLCICPVRTVNGATVAEGRIPGPITGRLMRAYCERVGFDWVQQYLRCLD